MLTYLLRETKARLKFKSGDGKKSSFASKLQSAKQKLEKFNLEFHFTGASSPHDVRAVDCD